MLRSAGSGRTASLGRATWAAAGVAVIPNLLAAFEATPAGDPGWWVALRALVSIVFLVILLAFFVSRYQDRRAGRS